MRDRFCPRCGRPHRSERNHCGACARAQVGIRRPWLEGGREAVARNLRRSDYIERVKDLNLDWHPYDGPGGARPYRLAEQRRLGVRICANEKCLKHHRDRSHTLCRQCRLVNHGPCIGCGKPFRGEPPAKLCNSCRNRAQRERRKLRAESTSYYDATGALNDPVI